MDPTEEELERFAATFQRFTERMSKLGSADRASPIRALIDEHLGTDTSRASPAGITPTSRWR
jgi:hypothetical protein